MTVRLGYRPPYDVDAMLGFFATRAIEGMERVEGRSLARTLAITTGGRTFAFQPLSPSVLSMIEAGGLVPHLRKKLGLHSTEEVKIAD